MGCCGSKKKSAEKPNTKEKPKDEDKKLGDVNQQDEDAKEQQRRKFQDINKNRQKKDPDTPDDGMSDQEYINKVHKNGSADPNAFQKTKKSTKLVEGADLVQALKRAIHEQDEELLEEVLDKDPQLCKFKIDDAKNVQVIHKACQVDNSNIIKALVDKGADIDCQDNKRWTPLIIASMMGNYPVVSYLVRQGANMGLEDNEGKTAREYTLDALDEEYAKPNKDIKTKQKIQDLTKILKLLPDEDKEGEINDEETPNVPGSRI